MDWRIAGRLATMGGALALSACMMPYDGGLYEAPPAPVYSAVESPDEYRFIDRADSLWETIGDAPPDNAFAFEGAEPWAWELADGHRIVVEEGADGMRSYFFAPGDEGPFLAVRPGMSFGFDGEAVAVIYGPDGGAMPREAGTAHLGEGVDLYARGRLLLRAMLQKQWRAVDSQAWIDASPIWWSSFHFWNEGKRRHSGWGRHREQWRDAEWRRRLEAERLRRRERAEAFRRWREGGFQGPPPGHWHKPAPGAGRPGRPGRPGGVAPGVERPRQPGQWHRPGGPGAGRPRPDAGQPRPAWPRGPRRPPGANPTDGGPVEAGAPQTLPAPVPGDRPRRPGWGGRPRPGGGAAQPDGTTAPGPTPQARPPRWTRPEGGRPGWRRPPPAEGGAAAPSPTPAPRWTRPEGGRQGWRRPAPVQGGIAAPSPAPRPSYTPSTPQRPSYTPSPPPAPRAVPPPRPAPPPRSTYTPGSRKPVERPD